MGIKQWTVGKGAPELTENVCTQGTGAHFSAPIQGLYSGTGTISEFWRGHLWCVHIIAQWESYSGTKCEHSLSVSFYLGWGVSQESLYTWKAPLRDSDKLIVNTYKWDLGCRWHCRLSMAPLWRGEKVYWFTKVYISWNCWVLLKKFSATAVF